MNLSAAACHARVCGKEDCFFKSAYRCLKVDEIACREAQRRRTAITLLLVSGVPRTVGMHGAGLAQMEAHGDLDDDSEEDADFDAGADSGAGEDDDDSGMSDDEDEVSACFAATPLAKTGYTERARRAAYATFF
jgi:hypothetical protein